MATIVLIEPDRVLAASCLYALQQDGHRVTWCNDAQQAMQAIDETKPDCIVLEIQLVLHNGIELLYELRSYKDLEHIPVVVHTFAPPAAISANQRTMLHITDVLYKPHTTLQALTRAVSRSQPVIA